MTRERSFLADRGFVALHVDYRNHAESTDDPRVETAVRLDCSADVIAAARGTRGVEGRPRRPRPDRALRSVDGRWRDAQGPRRLQPRGTELSTSSSVPTHPSRRCPPPWATATQRALTAAGVDSTLQSYDDGHAFGPAFIPAMDRTVRFLRARMPA